MSAARGSLRAAPAAVLLALVALTSPVSAASAQVLEPAPGAVRIEIEALTGTLLPEADLRIQLRVTNSSDRPLDSLRVLGTIHSKVSSRYELQQALDQGVVGDLWSSYQTEVEPVAARRSRVVALTRTAAELGFSRPDDKFGVYPMLLQLQQHGETVAETRTGLVLSPRSVARPVLAALLIPLDHAPALRAEDAYLADELAAAVQPGGRLRELTHSVMNSPPIALTVAANGLLLEEVSDLANGFVLRDGQIRSVRDADSSEALAAAEFAEQVERLAGRRATEQIALPYGAADLAALVRGDMVSEAERHLMSGRRTVQHVTGSTPTTGILWPPAGLDEDTLAVAAGALGRIETVVLSEGHLDIPRVRDLPVSPSPVRRLRGVGEPVTALVPDPWLEELLAAPTHDDGLASAVQRIMAETAVVHFELPFAQQTRGLLLAPPQLWDPPPGLVHELLSQLASAPWLRPATLSQLAEQAQPQPGPTELRYAAAERSAELPARYIAELRVAREQLGSLAAVLPTNEVPARADRLLRGAASAHLRDPHLQAAGSRMVRTVTTTATRLFSAVSVVEQTPVTLTSIEGPVPVTIHNSSDTALQVRVRLESPRYSFGEGGTVEMVLPAQTQETLTFDVRPLSPGGTYPIRVMVEDPHGAIALAQGSVVVRSAAYSAVALVVTGGAGLFLLAWWTFDAVRRRRLRAAPA